MKIEIYISQLLHRYQCVIVPEFGAFLSDFQSAQINENSNSFYPPRKIISFNSNLINNDGLLANHISQIEKISFEKAVQNIHNEVEFWKVNLFADHSIQIVDIGKLTINLEKNLVFEAFNTTNFNTDSFGLSSYIAPSIKRENTIASIKIETETPVIEFVSNANSKHNYFKYVAIFVVSIGLLGILGNNYFQKKIAAETQLVQVEVQKEVQNKIQEATFFIKNPLPNVTLTIKESEMSFHVVAGAFRNEKNAIRIFEKLSQQGFEARRLEKNKFGLFPVLFGSYATYKQAHSAMLAIRKSQSPEAWLMIKSF